MGERLVSHQALSSFSLSFPIHGGSLLAGSLGHLAFPRRLHVARGLRQAWGPWAASFQRCQGPSRQPQARSHPPCLCPLPWQPGVRMQFPGPCLGQHPCPGISPCCLCRVSCFTSAVPSRGAEAGLTSLSWVQAGDSSASHEPVVHRDDLESLLSEVMYHLAGSSSAVPPLPRAASTRATGGPGSPCWVRRAPQARREPLGHKGAKRGP